MKKLFTKKSLRILVVILVLALLQITGFLGWLGGLASRALTPVYTFVYEQSTTIKRWVDIYNEPSVLIERNSDLESENARLKDDINLYRQLAQENEHLRSILLYQEESGVNSLAAKVVTRWDLGGETILTLNKGEIDSVREGDLVLDENGVLVGKISDVSRSVSRVQLMTHPDFKMAVKRAGEVSPLGILKGQFLISGVVELIPQDSELSVGEEILTANLQGVPGGIRIGAISEIKSNPGDLFKTASVSPLYNLDEIVFLQIIRRLND